MEYFIHWAGFVGAWLLVAGPLVQAALELREEELDREAFEAVSTKVSQPPPISNWWWLLPPVAYVKNRRRSTAQRKAYMLAMTAEQRKQLIGFTNKATGWLFVAGGASLIFLKEAWELSELYEAPVFVFWIVVVVLAILAVANTVARLSRSDEMIHADDPGYRERQQQERKDAMAAAKARRASKPVN